tara:strand:+ start:39 stop:590 length:552 start_codon:yes stop_codon:yes gene_type:complete
MTNIPSQVFNISLHCVVLFTFLTIFYWNFIVYEEIDAIYKLIKENVIDNLNNMFNNNIKILELTLKTDYNPILDPLNKSIQGDNIIQDKLYELNHDKYKSINIIILLLLYIVFLLILYYLFENKYDINYKEIIIENIILIFLIGTIEGTFFLLIAKQYIPIRDVDINETMIEIINSLDINNKE